MTKIIKRRKLHGLESDPPHFAQIDDPLWPSLSAMLDCATGDKVFVCGSLDKMTREWMLEPLRGAWEIEGEFVFKHRTAVYYRRNPPTKRVTIKLVSHRESWFPGCEDATVATRAWIAFRDEWPKDVPILSSPATTGKTLLWESLPRDVEFPALRDDLARLIRANSPQHRIEVVTNADCVAAIGEKEPGLIQYDGRWMYAAMCGLDRFPVGEPKRAGGFREYQPGIYDVTVRIPETWNHIGLIPQKGEGGEWFYPSAPGLRFRTWAFEPELTFALKNKVAPWEIVEVHDGYTFDKGRPLLNWSNKLIEMRERLQDAESYMDSRPRYYAASAIRQILNHAIGSIHKNEYQREMFIDDDEYRAWRRENPFLAEGDDIVKVESGYLVPRFVPDTSRLSIFMPHWSSTLYSLARARVAEWALRCDPSTLVKIHGDAIYSTIEQPELDKLDTQRLGQPRRKS